MLKLKEEEILYLLEEQLPDMLERNPDLETRAFRAFLRVFTTKEETAAILNELRSFHEEFHHFRVEAQEQFEQVNQRFEQVDQRFEQVDQRFEQVDQRFEQVDRQFVELRQEMRQGFQEVRQEISDLRSWAELLTGRVQNRAGRNLEDVVAGALRSALRRSDIKPDQLRLRQTIVDEQGLVGLPGKRRFEIDILAEDGKLTVFEVKTFCDWDDVNTLADRVEVVQALNPDKKVEGVMIAIGIDYGVPERCAELGITLVYHGEDIPA